MDKLKSVKKVFKTGGDFNFPVLLWDFDVEANTKTEVNIASENLEISCSVFDRQNRKLADAEVTTLGSLVNGILIKIEHDVTKLWKPCEDARFDLKVVNKTTGDVRYSQTVYFDIERGLS